MRVALIGNIANNAFNMTNLLLAEGVEARLIDDGLDNFPFSRPSWEETSHTLPYDEVMGPQQTLKQWRSKENRLGWQAGKRVLYPTQPHGLLDRFRDIVFRIGRVVKEHPKARVASFDSDIQAMLLAWRDSYPKTIAALSRFDVLVGFGLHAALCSYWANRPTIYFTYGGDCRVQLANSDGKNDLISRCLQGVLASDRFVLEGYGCDHEIHNILREKRLLEKTEYAYLPNINRSLFQSPWDQAQMRERLGWPQEKTLFFVASRVDYRWKQTDRFLEAYAEFAEGRDDLLLVLSGWGRDFEAARKKMFARGLSEQIRFLTESFSKPRLFELYGAADVVVDQFAVGSLGSVSFEGICMGKPVMTYLAPFNQLSYAEAPPIINVQTASDIRRALRDILDHPERLHALGSEAARWYDRLYSPTNLSHCVREIAHSGPQQWMSYAGRQGKTLPDHAVPIPNSDASLSILPWPYPFKAGLALANDCEYYNWDDFCSLHDWLNTELKLPVSDSFWFYSEEPTALGFSYFEGTDHRKPSALAPYMDELLTLGYLDTLHTYGGFDLHGSFGRDHALAAVDTLKALNVKVTVWSNHGNTNNSQNLGGLWPNDYAQGDIPDSRQYHADLLPELGVRFTWLDAYATNRFSLGNRRGRHYTNGLAAQDDSHWGDKLLCRDRLRDGQPITAFRRFRGARPLAPDSQNIGEQLSNGNLDHLEASGGAAIIYQHLGCRREAGGRPVSRCGQPLPPNATEQLVALAERYHNQTVWVAPTARFLAYLEAVSELRFDLEPTEHGVVLILYGHRKELQESDLNNIHLRVDGSANIIDVLLQSHKGVRSRCTSVQRRNIGDNQTLLYWNGVEWPSFPFSQKVSGTSQ